MPVSDLHRQIAVLALAAAGEHGFALGGASAVLARGVISRPRLNGLQSRLPRGSDQRPPGVHRPPPQAIERATVIFRLLAADQPAAFLPDLASSLNNQSNRRPVLRSATTIRWLPSWGDLIQARARSSHPAGRPGTQAPARRAAAACQPGNRTASLLSVHKHVDHLCATAPSLCKPSGNAGDSAAWPQPW
jgi:hypothetical protein